MTTIEQYLANLNQQTTATSTSISTILKGQIAETQNKLSGLIAPFQNQLNTLNQQLQEAQNLREENKTVTQNITGYKQEYYTTGDYLHTGPRHQDYTNYVRQIPIYGQSTVTYDPKYDDMINNIKAQIQSVQDQISKTSQPFTDSLKRYTDQLSTLDADKLTPGQNNTKPTALTIGAPALIIAGGLAYLLLKH